MVSRNRLNRELMALNNTKDIDILLNPINDNLFHWQGLIKGPPETPYERGWFKLDFKIDQNYPINPPKVKFLTRIFHPNIHFETGEICLDILKAQHWSPAWTLESLCRAIVNLLVNPNADSPLNCDSGNMIRAGDMVAFRTMAYMYTVENACEDTVFEAETVLISRKKVE